MNKFKNVIGQIGQTPLIKIESLSKLTRQNIFVKAEHLNPGGSVKDRAALSIIETAEKNQLLKPGYRIYEGTAGNTGIGLALVANQKGYSCTVVMPNNQSQEKYEVLKALGVELVTVDPCPFSNENHFYHTAKRLAAENPQAFWANQFENLANAETHYLTTGPEIYQALEAKVDYFVSASGTGGTIGGVSKFLKEKNQTTRVILADPEGSGLYQYIKSGEMKSTGSSITEGIGIMRVTANFKEAHIDDALCVTDSQMIQMYNFLCQKEGLIVGTSAALNLYATYHYANLEKNKGLNFVTILCDSGHKYFQKTLKYNKENVVQSLV